MSKIKIYDGVTIDMGTSRVLELGEARFIDSSDIAHCGGGGGSAGTTSTTSGFDPKYAAQTGAAITAGQGLYNQGKLGQVVGFTPAQLQAQQAGMGAAGQQQGIENMMYNQAMQPTDLTGMRAGALQQAQQALNIGAANTGRAGGLGGSRQYLNQQSITNDLAAKFGQIDMQKQQLDMANRGQALGAQGAGAETIAAIGMGQQQQAQNVADAPYAGLSQLSNIYGGFMPKQTNVTSNRGGGK